MSPFVYVVGRTSHIADSRCPETSSTILGVFEDEEEAYKHAAEGQLRYIEEMIENMRESDDEDVENDESPREKVARIRNMDSWEDKSDAAIDLLSKLLPEPMYTPASQVCYTVLEMELNCLTDRCNFLGLC
ncbi:hypothetical protein BGX21_007284 [Mortierella sp. AD011]|nr:hypothetical protein BGX21_007284 [Mortierella sp. AD011]